MAPRCGLCRGDGDIELIKRLLRKSAQDGEGAFPAGYELGRAVSGSLIFVTELSCVQIDLVSRVVYRVRTAVLVGLNTLLMLRKKQFIMSDTFFQLHLLRC